MHNGWHMKSMRVCAGNNLSKQTDIKLFSQHTKSPDHDQDQAPRVGIQARIIQHAASTTYVSELAGRFQKKPRQLAVSTSTITVSPDVSQRVEMFISGSRDEGRCKLVSFKLLDSKGGFRKGSSYRTALPALQISKLRISSISASNFCL